MTQADSVIEVREFVARLTVQDLGRRGSQRYGVSVSGVLDFRAAILGNRLVGNPITSAVLESTYGGTELRFDQETRVAVTGAELDVAINGFEMPTWETLIIPQNGVLSIGGPINGLHSYVAVAGGIDSPLVLGSRSTHVASGIGGAALTQGDLLHIGNESAGEIRPHAGSRASSEIALPTVGDEVTIRAIKGPQYDSFGEEARRCFWEGSYEVSIRSDRQGMRLEGSRVDAIDGRHDIVSDAAYMGAVQVPGDGMPIVLLADRQTTGGYTKIASVIRADLPALVQRPPGSAIRFSEVGIEEAESLARDSHWEMTAASLAPPEGALTLEMRCDGADFEVSLARPSVRAESEQDAEMVWASIGGAEDVSVAVERFDS